MIKAVIEGDIAAGAQIFDDLAIYGDLKARELAILTGPGQNDRSFCLVWTFTC